jgi:prepilin-type N-terminal cleavage/methylation domain-containing protein
MKKGFTLVEMLVVIVILGILMAMMVPAAGVILKRAKVAQAKSDAGVVVTVLLKYYSEYNRWPAFAFNADPQHLTESLWVQTMSPSPDGVPPDQNVKRIVFFSAGGGVLEQATGNFIDPWGKPFEYQVDLDRDGNLANPNGEGQTLRAQVVAWSAGPDGDYATWPDNATSWE